jgi:hypothetical protein
VPDHSVLFDRPLAASDTFKNSKPPLRLFVGRNIDKIRSRASMLGYKHRLAVG